MAGSQQIGRHPDWSIFYYLPFLEYIHISLWITSLNNFEHMTSLHRSLWSFPVAYGANQSSLSVNDRALTDVCIWLRPSESPRLLFELSWVTHIDAVRSSFLFVSIFFLSTPSPLYCPLTSYFSEVHIVRPSLFLLCHKSLETLATLWCSPFSITRVHIFSPIDFVINHKLTRRVFILLYIEL
jgi:hypothetical protein